MPKPITIEISVEEIAFGKVFRTLDGMPGVASINIKGSGAKSAPKTNGSAPRKHGRTSEGTTGRCIVLKTLLGQKKPMRVKDLSAVAEAAGKAPNSLGNALFGMIKQKYVTRSEDGYKITERGRSFLMNNCKQENK